MTADVCPFCGYAKHHPSDTAYACGTYRRPDGVYVVTEGCVRAILYAKGLRCELELPDLDSSCGFGDEDSGWGLNDSSDDLEGE